MKTNAAGLALVKRYEGYGRELPDGSCTAYQEIINGKADVPTIGFGCTKNVKMGMVWTREQAEQALLAELAIHEERVTRLVTVELNENEFSALVSFDFNCGGLTVGNNPSRVLKAVNRGDRAATVAEMKQWNHFAGKVAKGLTSRRAAEVALFLEPVEPVGTSYMPQSATPAARPMSRWSVASLWASASAGVTTVVHSGLPAPPAQLTASADNLSAWQGLAGTIGGAVWSGWGLLTIAGLAVYVMLGHVLPAFADKEG